MQKKLSLYVTRYVKGLKGKREILLWSDNNLRRETRHLILLMGRRRRFTFYVKPSSRLTLFCFGMGSSCRVYFLFRFFCRQMKYFIVVRLTRHITSVKISNSFLYRRAFMSPFSRSLDGRAGISHARTKSRNIWEKETNKSDIVDKATPGISIEKLLRKLAS